jgi:transposase
LPPQFVKPYVKGNKNDANDAAAICEAVGRPSMRFVPIKSIAQQDLQALHRIRSELVQQRTAKVNQIRGLLGEYGIVMAQRVESLRKALPELLEEAENGQRNARRPFALNHHRRRDCSCAVICRSQRSAL